MNTSRQDMIRVKTPDRGTIYFHINVIARPVVDLVPMVAEEDAMLHRHVKTFEVHFLCASTQIGDSLKELPIKGHTSIFRQGTSKNHMANNAM